MCFCCFLMAFICLASPPHVRPSRSNLSSWLWRCRFCRCEKNPAIPMSNCVFFSGGLLLGNGPAVTFSTPICGVRMTEWDVFVWSKNSFNSAYFSITTLDSECSWAVEVCGLGNASTVSISFPGTIQLMLLYPVWKLDILQVEFLLFLPNFFLPFDLFYFPSHFMALMINFHIKVVQHNIEMCSLLTSWTLPRVFLIRTFSKVLHLVCELVNRENFSSSWRILVGVVG